MAHGLDLSSVGLNLLLVFSEVLVCIKKQPAQMVDVKFYGVRVRRRTAIFSAAVLLGVCHERLKSVNGERIYICTGSVVSGHLIANKN